MLDKYTGRAEDCPGAELNVSLLKLWKSFVIFVALKIGAVQRALHGWF